MKGAWFAIKDVVQELNQVLLVDSDEERENEGVNVEKDQVTVTSNEHRSLACSSVNESFGETDVVTTRNEFSSRKKSALHLSATSSIPSSTGASSPSSCVAGLVGAVLPSVVAGTLRSGFRSALSYRGSATSEDQEKVQDANFYPPQSTKALSSRSNHVSFSSLSATTELPRHSDALQDFLRVAAKGPAAELFYDEPKDQQISPFSTFLSEPHSFTRDNHEMQTEPSLGQPGTHETTSALTIHPDFPSSIALPLDPPVALPTVEVCRKLSDHFGSPQSLSPTEVLLEEDPNVSPPQSSVLDGAARAEADGTSAQRTENAWAAYSGLTDVEFPVSTSDVIKTTLLRNASSRASLDTLHNAQEYEQSVFQDVAFVRAPSEINVSLETPRESEERGRLLDFSESTPHATMATEKSVLFETMRNDSIAKADDGVQGLRTTTAQHHEAEEKALVLPERLVNNHLFSEYISPANRTAGAETELFLNPDKTLVEVTASVDAPVENGGSSSEDVADVTGTVESPLASETYLHETTALLPGPPETVALELSTSAYAMNTLMQDQDCMEHKERHWNETNFRTAFDALFDEVEQREAKGDHDQLVAKNVLLRLRRYASGDQHASAEQLAAALLIPLRSMLLAEPAFSQKKRAVSATTSGPRGKETSDRSTQVVEAENQELRRHLKNVVNKAKKSFQKFQNELEQAYEHKLDVLQSDLEASRLQNAQLQQRCSTLERTEREWHDKLLNYQYRLQQMDVQNRELEEQLGSWQRSHADIIEKNARLTDEAEKLAVGQQAVEALNGQIAELQYQLSAQTDLEENLRLKEKEVNDLNAELHLVKEELKDSRDMVNRLNKLIDDMHADHASTVSSLQSWLTDTQTRAAEAEASVLRLNEQVKTLATLKEQNEKLQSELEVAQKMSEEKEKHNATLNDAIKSLLERLHARTEEEYYFVDRRRIVQVLEDFYYSNFAARGVVNVLGKSRDKMIYILCDACGLERAQWEKYFGLDRSLEEQVQKQIRLMREKSASSQRESTETYGVLPETNDNNETTTLGETATRRPISSLFLEYLESEAAT